MGSTDLATAPASEPCDEVPWQTPGELLLPVTAKPMASLQRILRAAALLDALTHRAARSHALQSGDLVILHILERSRNQIPIRAVDLQKALLNTSGAITKRIDRLQAAGLVQRFPDPRDGRASLVKITDQGVSLTATIRAAQDRDNEDRISNTLSDTEWGTLYSLLNRVIGTMEARVDKAARVNLVDAADS